MAIKAEWLDRHNRHMLFGCNRGACLDLILKMIEGGVAFTADDKFVYEWLLQNLSSLFAGTIYAKHRRGFRMVLKNAWAGGEKVFFDLELLRKLDIALSVYAPAIDQSLLKLDQHLL